MNDLVHGMSASARALAGRAGGTLRLWRYEAYRTGRLLLFAPLALAIAGSGFLIVVHAVGQPVGRIAGSLLEAVLPLTAAITTAGLVGSDPVLELHLSLPTRYRTTLVRRFAVTLASCAITCASVAVVFAALGVLTMPTGFTSGQLAWLIPLVMLCAIAALVAATSGSGRVAAGFVAGLWVAEEYFKSPLITPGWVQPWYLFATFRADGAPYRLNDALTHAWFVNRAALAALSPVFLIAAWHRLARAHRLLTRRERA